MLALLAEYQAWPYLYYPMYSSIYGKRDAYVHIVGVTADGEVPLKGYKYFSPLDHGRIDAGLRAMESLEDGAARVRVAHQYLLKNYESRRLAGQHDGPLLRGLRFYDWEWRDNALLEKRAPILKSRREVLSGDDE